MKPFARTPQIKGQHPDQRRPKGLATLSRLGLILTLLATLLVLIVVPAKPANAAAGTNADDELGQTTSGSNNFAQSLPDDQNVSNKGMYGPQGVVIDPTTGYMFVADYSDSRVLAYTTDPTTHLPAATPFAVLGQPDFTTVTAGRTQSKLNQPVGLAIDASREYLYVSDYSNGRVMVFNVATVTTGQNAAYVIGKSGFTLSTPASGGSGLTQPKGLAYEASTKMLYVADGGNSRVMIFDMTTMANTPTAVHVLGQPNVTTYTANNTINGMSSPSGLAHDPTNHYLFVTDNNLNRVTAYSTTSITDGQNAIGIYGQADYTSASSGFSSSKFNSPLGVAVDVTRGRLYVSDTNNNRVEVYPEAPQNTGPTATFVIGQASQSGTSALLSASGLSAPRHIFYDSTYDRVYVADNTTNRIMVFDGSASADGPTAIFAVGHVDSSGSPDYTNDVRWGGGPSTTGTYLPTATAIDTIRHRLFIADYSNNRVVVHNLDNSNRTIDNVADFVLGEPDFVSRSGAFTAAGLLTPGSVAYSPTTNRLFVFDNGHNRILVYNISTITNGMVAAYVLGASNFTTGTGTVSQSTFGNGRLALDDLGNRLFVSDSTANRILVFNVDMATIATGENASNVLGQTTFGLNGAGNSSTTLNGPRGLAYDSANSRLFVADFNGNRVMVYDASSFTNGKAAAYVLGQAGFGTSTVATTQTGMNKPNDVAYDQTYNRLWVAEGSNVRVTEYDGTAIVNGAPATNVYGQPDYVTATSSTNQSALGNPTGVTYDPVSNRIVVSDQSNHRVMFWRVGSRISTTTLPDATTNRAYSANVNLNVTQGTATYSIGSGALPAGLSLSSAGVISGTPTAVGGVYTFTVATSDNAGTYGTFADTKAMSIVVTSSNSITGTSPDALWGQYSGGSATYTQLGADSTGPSGNGFNAPSGTVFDANTNTLFVADNTANRVLAFLCDPTTHVPAITAYAVLGQPDFTTVSSGNGTSKMNGPRQLAIDSVRHQLFVTDAINDRVLVFDISSAVSTNPTPTYVIGKPTLAATTPTNGSNGLFRPIGITYDSTTKYLYVADASNNRVMVFNLTTMSNGPTAINVLGQPNFTTYATGTTATGMRGPFSLAIDTSLHYLFVAESTNNRVLGFNVSSTTDGMAATGIFGQPDLSTVTAGTTANKTNSPNGVAVDMARNRLYVSDTKNNRILVFSDASLPSASPSATYYVGQTSATVGTAKTTSQGLSNPHQVAYDSTSDSVIITDGDNNRLLYFDGSFASNNPVATRAVVELTGTGTYDFTSDAMYGAVPTDSGSYRPQAAALDTTNHRMYIADFGNNRILVHTLTSGNQFVDKNADYVIGQADYVSRQPGTGAANLSGPTALVYDSTTSYLYVYDSTNLRVLVYNANSLATGMSASYVLGAASFVAGTGALSSTTFGAGRGLALDIARHTLFVVSTGNRILTFDTSALVNGETASYVIGQSGFTTNTAGTTASTLSAPAGATYDSYSDILWVVDATNARVLGYPGGSVATNMAATAILGNTIFTTITNGLTQTQFALAASNITADSTYHRLWVSDAGNNRVLEFSTDNFTNGEKATSVFGQPDFTTSSVNASGLGVTAPYGSVWDPATNRLWVTENTNNRLTAWEVGTRVTTVSLPNATTAGAYSSQLTNTAAHGAVTYALTSGSMPSGMSLSSAGLLSGTVTASAGAYTFSVGLTDANGSYGTFKDYKTYTVTVPPSFSFGISAVTSCNGVSQSAGVTNSSTSIVFGHMSAASSAISMQGLTVNANALSGFNVYMSSTGLSDGFGHTVPNVSGTNASPGAAPVGGTSGVGYTTDDSTLGNGTPNRFTNPSAQWAGLSANGDLVDSSVTGTGGSSQNQCVAVQTAFGTSTSAGSYSGTLIYTALPLF